jgi:hypothetical protein
LDSTSETLSEKGSAAVTRKVAFAALHHRDFRAFFITTMLAMMADNIEHVISYWLLFQKFHWSLAISAMALMAVTLALLGFTIAAKSGDEIG